MACATPASAVIAGTGSADASGAAGVGSDPTADDAVPLRKTMGVSLKLPPGMCETQASALTNEHCHRSWTVGTCLPAGPHACMNAHAPSGPPTLHEGPCRNKALDTTGLLGTPLPPWLAAGTRRVLPCRARHADDKSVATRTAPQAAPEVLANVKAVAQATDHALLFDLPVSTASCTNGDGYASWGVQFHPNGGHFEYARSSARTPHGGASYVQMSGDEIS